MIGHKLGEFSPTRTLRPILVVRLKNQLRLNSILFNCTDIISEEGSF